MQHLITACTDAHLPAVTALAAATLDLPEDATESAALVRRLLSPPHERRTVRLVAVDGSGTVSGVAFASVRNSDPAVGHLDLVAVHPAVRRRGIGRALVSTAEQTLREYGVREIRIAGNDPCYAWPGIDVRYTPAVCMALALGFDQDSTAWNMAVDLSAVEDTAAEEARLADVGVSVRQAGADDADAAGLFAAAHFGGGWPWEVREAIQRGAAGEVAGCQLAFGVDRLLGFAAYGALRPSLFGPMGTLPAAQGIGIGAVLLRRCLAEQRAAGLARAQIGWAGPVAFYSRTVAARIERVFLLYRKTLP